jgi:hypothetical protein
LLAELPRPARYLPLSDYFGFTNAVFCYVA